MDDESPESSSPQHSVEQTSWTRARLISPEAAAEILDRRRRWFLRRLGALLATAAAAFALTTWLLARQDSRSAPGAADGPESIVRQQLDALGRGELRAAYDLFTQGYRDRVPFAAFHDLVFTHPGMFHARSVTVESREHSAARAVMETHIVAADGAHYLARYTLILIEGQWWIDDLRWGREPEPRGRFSACARCGPSFAA
jgi:hypothetical protein